MAKMGERNPMYGKHHSIETRKKQRAAMIGRHHSAEALKRMRIAKTGERHPMYGKHHSTETRAKISAATTGERNHMYGKHPSEETLNKMRITQAGERHHNYGKHPSKETLAKMCEAQAGERHYNYGRHHSAITKRKISVALSGPNNPSWRGGVSFLPYPVEWSNHLRETIRKRDNYTCALCGKVQITPRHDVHHINYKKEDLRPENLITLCANCHRKTNGDRKYWKNLFQMVYVPDFPKRRKNESSC